MLIFVLSCGSGEEGGAGKVLLWDKGAYEGLDVCLMYVLSSLVPWSRSPYLTRVAERV